MEKSVEMGTQVDNLVQREDLSGLFGGEGGFKWMIQLSGGFKRIIQWRGRIKVYNSVQRE